MIAQRAVDAGAVRLLGEFAKDGSAEIDDPMGGPEVAYEKCAGRIAECLEGFAAWLEDELIARA